MVNLLGKKSYDFNDLMHIVRILRAPGGCPWDREQTHQSIRRNFLEEVYEAVEAIDENSTDHLKEELGDVLLQVALHTVMEEESGRFTIDDVADGICKKLIYRHPHVFGDVAATTTGQVLANWEQLKRKEKGQNSTSDAMDAVSRGLPALWRAEKIQNKAARVGFDWDSTAGAMDKLAEETEELAAALSGDGDPVEELGDLLFAAVNVARFLKTDPEEALHAACHKFALRFRRVEERVAQQGRQMEQLSLAELDAVWEEIKHVSF